MVTAAAGEEEDQAEVSEERGELEVLVPVAVDVTDRAPASFVGWAPGKLAYLEPPLAQHSDQLVSRVVVGTREPRAIGEPEVVERWACATLTSRAVRQMAGVRSSVQTTMLTTSRVSRSTNQGAEKTRNKPSRSNRSTICGPTFRPGWWRS